MASIALSTMFSTARRSMSRSAATLKARRARRSTVSDRLRRQLRGQRRAHLARSACRSGKPASCGSRSEVKCNRSLTITSRAVKPAAILSKMSRLPESSGNAPPQQAQVERHGDEVVADFVGDVRGHLSQLGQAVFPRQLPVLLLQFVGQLLHFARSDWCVCSSRTVALCQAAKTVCKSELFVQQQRIGVDVLLAHWITAINSPRRHGDEA